MNSFVADTHAVLWYLLSPEKLSAIALDRFRLATSSQSTIFIPSICLVETQYLIERDKLPGEALVFLFDSIEDTETAFRLAPLEIEIARAVRHVSRDAVPDMPDRIIAATALALNLPLVTKDKQI